MNEERAYPSGLQQPEEFLRRLERLLVRHKCFNPAASRRNKGGQINALGNGREFLSLTQINYLPSERRAAK